MLNLVDKYELIFALPVSTSSNSLGTVGIKLPQNIDVLELPGWNSTFNYCKYIYRNKTITRRKLESVIKRADAIWIRIPSLAGIHIGQMCVENNKPLLVHLAGDIRKAAQNEKYSGVKHIPAFLLSQVMHRQIIKLVDANNPNIYPLCTGNALVEAFSYHPNTQFFIDSENDPPDTTPLRKSNVAKRFIYVGRLLPSKGIDLLVDLWRWMPQELHLDIVGYGESEEYVRQTDAIYDNITFHGFQTADELSILYRNVDCLIMPTINYPEGFPRVIAEAWNYGLAVISSDVGGISSVGKHMKNIVFTTPGNKSEIMTAVNRLSTDEKLFCQLIQNGLEAGKLVSKTRMLEQICLILNNYEADRR